MSNWDWTKLDTISWMPHSIHRAVKPETTMFEQLIADLPAVYDSYDGREALAQHLIDEGWVKKPLD